METLETNEIRDYLKRAPKRMYFDGRRMVNTMHVRFKWLSEIAIGTLDERINRRAGNPPDGSRGNSLWLPRAVGTNAGSRSSSLVDRNHGR